MARNRIATKAKVRKAPRPNGVVLYEGPSRIVAGTDIVVIATGLRTSSTNAKTGAMVQTWILCKDIHPQEALVTGQDAAICGGCKHRPRVRKPELGKYSERTCYVDIRAVITIWKAYKRGIYPKVATSEIADIFVGRALRLGSYGDPAGVPLVIWQLATSKTATHTGYTHQWKSERLRDVTSLCQASVDNAEEAAKVTAMGLGYFRVKGPEEPKLDGEIVCPASAEAGKVTTCAECRMCDGRGKTIVIDVHGIGSGNYQPTVPKASRTLTVI